MKACIAKKKRALNTGMEIREYRLIFVKIAFAQLFCQPFIVLHEILFAVPYFVIKSWL